MYNILVEEEIFKEPIAANYRLSPHPRTVAWPHCQDK